MAKKKKNLGAPVDSVTTQGFPHGTDQNELLTPPIGNSHEIAMVPV